MAFAAVSWDMGLHGLQQHFRNLIIIIIIINLCKKLVSFLRKLLIMIIYIQLVYKAWLHATEARDCHKMDSERY